MRFGFLIVVYPYTLMYTYLLLKVNPFFKTFSSENMNFLGYLHSGITHLILLLFAKKSLHTQMHSKITLSLTGCYLFFHTYFYLRVEMSLPAAVRENFFRWSGPGGAGGDR